MSNLEILPDGFAKTKDGRLWRRHKWDGQNYDYRTPVNHGVKDWLYDFYLVDSETKKIVSPRTILSRKDTGGRDDV